MKDALGLIEIKGLATAVLVADTMVKTANVTILEVEKTRGLGWMTVKIIGDVAAVTAAIQSGKQVGEQFQHFISSKVIPRPSDGVSETFCKPPVQSGGNAPAKSPEKTGSPGPQDTKKVQMPSEAGNRGKQPEATETEKKTESAQPAESAPIAPKSLPAASSGVNKKEESVGKEKPVVPEKQKSPLQKETKIKEEKPSPPKSGKARTKPQNSGSAAPANKPGKANAAGTVSHPLPEGEQLEEPKAELKSPAAHKRSGRRKKAPEGKDSGSHLHGESGR